MEQEPLICALAFSFVCKLGLHSPGEHGTILKELVKALHFSVGLFHVLQDIVAVCTGLVEQGLNVDLCAHTHQRCLLIYLQLEFSPDPVLHRDTDP